jgi:hypothetical protein
MTKLLKLCILVSINNGSGTNFIKAYRQFGAKYKLIESKFRQNIYKRYYTLFSLIFVDKVKRKLKYSQTPLVRTHRITRLNYVIMENTL